jgi:hypothetical protein
MADVRGLVQNAPGSVARQTRGNYRTLALTPDGAVFEADYLHSLAREGRIFIASPGAALNTTSLGAAATSFVATTPDFTLEVPSGTTCIPLRVKATQAGTVAGGAVSVIMGIQGAVERSSAGTAFANIKSTRTDALGVANVCTPYIAPTVATDTVGVAVYRDILTQTVTTTRPGLADDVDWMPYTQGQPIYLVGPSALKFYSFASSTAPTWFFELTWAEIPSTDLTT